MKERDAATCNTQLRGQANGQSGDGKTTNDKQDMNTFLAPRSCGPKPTVGLGDPLTLALWM